MPKYYKKKSHYISKKYGYTGKKKLFKRYTDPSFGEGLHNRKIELNFRVYVYDGKYSLIDNAAFGSRRVQSALILNTEFDALQTLFGLVKLLGVKLTVTRSGWSQTSSGSQTALTSPPLRILWSPYGEVSGFPAVGAGANDDCLVINTLTGTASKYYPMGRDLVQTGYGTTTSMTGGQVWTSTAFIDELPDWSGSLYLDTTEGISSYVPGAEVFQLRMVLYTQWCKPGYYITGG